MSSTNVTFQIDKGLALFHTDVLHTLLPPATGDTSFSSVLCSYFLFFSLSNRILSILPFLFLCLFCFILFISLFPPFDFHFSFLFLLSPFSAFFPFFSLIFTCISFLFFLFTIHFLPFSFIIFFFFYISAFVLSFSLFFLHFPLFPSISLNFFSYFSALVLSFSFFFYSPPLFHFSLFFSYFSTIVLPFFLFLLFILLSFPIYFPESKGSPQST
ncbi:unnamed protein product [Acanthosepion pharaonis]|uniref:Uncharacterized protein n=1 Tax=Acanthosepion pharaonis TaxID=158019 RepID=A0A812CZ96_ACAPH|nr:unnamed protein product [Sepia pharaonis]